MTVFNQNNAQVSKEENRVKQGSIHILFMVILKKNAEELQSCVIKHSLEVYYLTHVLN